MSTEYVDGLFPAKSVSSAAASSTTINRSYEKVVRTAPSGGIFEEEIPFFKRKPKKVFRPIELWTFRNLPTNYASL